MSKLQIVAIGLLVFISGIASKRSFHNQKSISSTYGDKLNQFWQRFEPVDQKVELAYTFAMKQPNLHILENHMEKVSDPASKHYGKYLSNNEIFDMIKAPKVAVDTLYAVLKQNGIPKSSVRMGTHGDYYSVHIPVEKAEKLFKTRLHFYTHLSTGSQLIRPHSKYSIPIELVEHIRFIDGLEYFPTQIQMEYSSKNKKFSDFGDGGLYNTNDRGNGYYIPSATPSVIRKQYHIPKNIDASYKNQNKILIASFLKEVYSPKDIRAYLSKYKIDLNTLPVSKQSCKSRENPTGEASLDTQVVLGISKNRNTVVSCFAGLRDNSKKFSDGNQEPFLKFAFSLNKMTHPPTVVSISYSDDECAVPRMYMESINTEFLKAGTKGITILGASGDNGVIGSKYLSFCEVSKCDKFQPGFPSSSPYITTVGGTFLYSNGKNTEAFTEVVASTSKYGNLITSGGGFSNIFRQPKYQRDHVQSYLQKSRLATSLFNSKGRGYPDVTAVSHKFPIFSDGGSTNMDGTSASTPLVASIISLLNKKRLQSGKPVLGFINPLLYKMHRKKNGVFRDIISGSNACGGTGQRCCASGFVAAKGWDAASGLGAILYSEFADSFNDFENIPILASFEDNTLGTQQQPSANHSSFTLSSSFVLSGIVVISAVLALFVKKKKSYEDGDRSNGGYLLNHNPAVLYN